MKRHLGGHHQPHAGHHGKPRTLANHRQRRNATRVAHGQHHARRRA